MWLIRPGALERPREEGVRGTPGQRPELQLSDRGAVPAGLIQWSCDQLRQGRVKERLMARGPRTQSRHLASPVTCVTFSPRRSLQCTPSQIRGRANRQSVSSLSLKKRSAAEPWFLFPSIFRGGEISSAHWIQSSGLLDTGRCEWVGGVCFGVLTLWQCACRSVHQITEASGLFLTHQKEALLTCESDDPAGPIIVHCWRTLWRACWIDAGLLKALPTAMAAVIYACLCPLGFYLHISSLRSTAHPFPLLIGAFPALCCTGIIVIRIPKNTPLYNFLH